MLVNISFSQTSCLLVSPKQDLSRLITHTLRQIGLVDVTKADDAEHCILQLTSSDFDVVFLLDLDQDEGAKLLGRIRRQTAPLVAAIPVISVAESWSADQIALLRNEGVTVLATLPLTMRTLLKYVTRALEPREFIATTGYRGPCRRGKDNPKYDGPCRRRTDKTASAPAVKPNSAAAHTLDDRPRRPMPLPPPRPPQTVDDADDSDKLTTPEMRQTRVVVDNAHNTAMHMDHLSSELKMATSPQQRAQLCYEIAMVSERMINLMSLADSRVRGFGCSDSVVTRLESIRTIIMRNAEGLAEAAAQRIIGECERILKRRNGIPLGVGVRLAHQIGKCDAIVGVIGGHDAMSETVAQSVRRARELADSVIRLETQSSLVIPDFTLQRQPRR
jgi:CheY-like chemotaxis protein